MDAQADLAKAEDLFYNGGAGECHRRLETLRAGRGEGHASYNFRHFLRDHTEDYKYDGNTIYAEQLRDAHDEDVEFKRQELLNTTYGWSVAYRLNHAEYWRARVRNQLCGRCGETLTAPCESWDSEMAPDMDGEDCEPGNDDWRGHVRTCLHCWRTLCFWCTKSVSRKSA